MLGVAECSSPSASGGSWGSRGQMCTLGLGPGSCALYDQLRECCLTWWERPLIMVIAAQSVSDAHHNFKQTIKMLTHIYCPQPEPVPWCLQSLSFPGSCHNVSVCSTLVTWPGLQWLMTPCHAVSRVLMTHVTLQTPARCYQAKPAPASPASRMCQCPGLWLVNISHVTSILASDWSDWPQTWPLIGWWPHSIKCMLSSKVSHAAWCCCKPKCRHEHSLSPAKSLSL